MLNLCNARKANYLLNVSPDRTGRIPDFLVQRLEEMVGAERFELSTSRTRTVRSTGLSHTPIYSGQIIPL